MVPALLRVGPARYDVVVKSLKKLDLFGRTSNTHTRIELHCGISKSAMQDTLVHEALHAVFHTAGSTSVTGLSDESEEVLCRILAPWLVGLIRDNPELIVFLQED